MDSIANISDTFKKKKKNIHIKIIRHHYCNLCSTVKKIIFVPSRIRVH